MQGLHAVFMEIIHFCGIFLFIVGHYSMDDAQRLKAGRYVKKPFIRIMFLLVAFLCTTIFLFDILFARFCCTAALYKINLVMALGVGQM